MPWNRWQAPDRDSVKIFDKVHVALGRQTRLLLQMEGAKGTVDADVEARTGTKLNRARRPHKLLERMGVLYLDGDGNTRLTDLGRSLREVPETVELRQRIAEAAIRVLAKYQLRNPVDDPKGNYPADTDLHPYWAIWKAAAELDWKLHWDELNRELFWVLRHHDLGDAIDRIRQARTKAGYDPTAGGTLRDRAYNQADAPKGKTPEGQVRDQKATPWFRKVGFGGLLLEEPGHAGGGYWSVPDDLRPLILVAVQEAPPFYQFEDAQDWYRYFGSYEAWAKAPTEIVPDQLKAAADAFSVALLGADLTFGVSHERFVRTFLASLVAKPFVILAGLSGLGEDADCTKARSVVRDSTLRRGSRAARLDRPGTTHRLRRRPRAAWRWHPGMECSSGVGVLRSVSPGSHETAFAIARRDELGACGAVLRRLFIWDGVGRTGAAGCRLGPSWEAMGLVEQRALACPGESLRRWDRQC